MRALLVLPVLLFVSTLIGAQPQPPPVQDPGVGQLDTVIGGWGKFLTSLRSLHAECKRTTIDNVFLTKEVFTGSVKYLKAPAPGQGSRASLELHKQTAQGPSATIFEKYVYNGTSLYEYVPASKLIRVHDLSASKAEQIADDNLLSFVPGMKAIETIQRYELTLTTGGKDFVTVTPSDKYYYYLRIRAKQAQDKADFTVARLVLHRDSFLPIQVWFQQPNGNEVTWDVKVQANIEFPLAAFEQPRLDPGWQFERIPAQATAKIRNTGP